MGNVLNQNVLSRLSNAPGGDAVNTLLRSGVPRRHLRFIPEMEDHKDWVQKRNRMMRLMGTGCLISIIGNRGTGKTQAAAHACAMTAKSGREVRYVKAMEVFLSIRATYAKPDVSELEVIEGFRRPSLLVIDEMQQRGDTLFEDRILAHLIDRRYDDMTDTILIANLTPKALADSLDASIVDRLRETGGIVEFVWDSFRSKGVASDD